MVNDVAKRGVKLKSDFNDLITRDEDQKQFLFKLLENIGKSLQTSTNQYYLATHSGDKSRLRHEEKNGINKIV